MKKFLAIIAILLTTLLAQAQEYRPAAIKKHNEGVIYYDKKQYNNAIDCFLEAVTIDPNFVHSYYNLGVLYEYYGQSEKAIAAYKNIIKLDPYNANAAYKVALLSYKQRNYKVAETYLNLIQKNSPKYQQAQELRAKITSNTEKEQKQYNIFLGDSAKVFPKIATPTGITKDSLGNIYVSNFANNSITQISGNSQRCFYRGAPLSGPMGLAVDKYNNIYAACYNSGKIVAISQDGSKKVVLEKLLKPHSLFIDAENYLYVSEQGKNDVIKYKLY